MPASKAAEEAPADAAAKAAEDCPASSWPGPDGKCSKNASILSSMAPDKTLGVFGNAKFSARGPRPRAQHMLMILGGRKSRGCGPIRRSPPPICSGGPLDWSAGW